jgi:hypothetical protein
VVPNVGIGTTNPAATNKVQISGSASGSTFIGIIIGNSGAGAGTASDLRFAVGSDGSSGTTGVVSNVADASGASLAFTTYKSGVGPGEIENSNTGTAAYAGIGLFNDYGLLR